MAQNPPDDTGSMSDEVFEDQEITAKRAADKQRRLKEQNPFESNTPQAYNNDEQQQQQQHQQHHHQHQQQHHHRQLHQQPSTSALNTARNASPHGYPGYRPAREALQMYAYEDASYRLNTDDDDDNNDDGWRSYRYEEVGMYPYAHQHHHHQQQQPFDDTVNHKTILLGDSGVGKTSFLVKYNTGEFRLGSFSATVGIALTVVFVGDSGTGKTCFFIRFMEPTSTEQFFQAFSTTVGVDVRNKVVIVDGTRVKLQIWDTAGQERFRSVTHAYYRDAHALLLLYDVTNKTTFDNIRAWLGEIRDYAQDDVVILLIGNKADCSNSDRQVKREDGERLAREHNVPFMETSAKTGQNVELSFAAIARQLKSRGSGNGDADRFNVHDFVRDNTKVQSACMQCKYQ